MAEYQCIGCGEVKESEAPCSCPMCGYKMYQAPYVRREVLLGEIRGFIKQLELCEIRCGDLSYYRLSPRTCMAADGREHEAFDRIPKAKDDARFPHFDRIRDYVCGAEKTEIFKERLDTTLVRLRKHIHEPFSQEYKTDLDRIKHRLDELDAVLKQALDELNIKARLTEAVMPEITLTYREFPDRALSEIADRLLDELELLSAKLQRFIKQNNLYGIAYRHKTEITFEPSQAKTHADALNGCLAAVSEVNAKSFVVDIFSDGSDELDEMLNALWNAVFAILTLPVLKQEWLFTFADGKTATERDICGVLAQTLHERYADVDEKIDSAVFLSDREESAVFTLYDRMIEWDPFGSMESSKEGLLHVSESEKRLNALIGLSAVKKSIKKIKAYASANQDDGALNIHMCFYGNPGTGKTEVARMVAGILYENKLLPANKVVEVDRSGLVSQYFGATAEKTQQVIRQAMGGVLFVDEAYALANSSDTQGITDYGREAIDTLVKAMEDYRGKFCVIFAGYRNEMLKMLSANPGMRSRIQFELDFPNYSREELRQITELMLKQRGYTITDAAMDRILDVTDAKRKEPNFANAREIRNIVEQVIMCQNLRSVGEEDREIGMVDVDRYLRDVGIRSPASRDEGSEPSKGGHSQRQIGFMT